MRVLLMNFLFSSVGCSFTPDSLFWGNASQYMQPYMIYVNALTDHTIYTTQTLSNYTKQCSTFTNTHSYGKNISVLLTYFSTYDDSFQTLRNNDVFCNYNYPMIFIRWDHDTNHFTMLKPLIHEQTPQSVVSATIDSVFMRGDLNVVRQLKGTHREPIEYVYHYLNPCTDGSLLYEESLGLKDITVCQKIATLYMINKTRICDLNIYDFEALDTYHYDIEELKNELYYPIFVEYTTFVKDICPIACGKTLGSECNPSPPPPSPPPPIIVIQLECEHVYNLGFGWNSIAFIGDETTYYTNNSNLAVYVNANDFLSIPNIFYTVDNSFDLYVNNTNGTSLITNCSNTIYTTCTQQVQVNNGKTPFGIRSNFTIDPNNIQFYQDPAYGDVISNNDRDNFQFFVFSDRRWKNLTSLDRLMPYVGYSYETIQENTFEMTIC